MSASAAEQTRRMHASCVAVAGRAVLITGKAGSGKSTLALRMMALGAELVADDQVLLKHEADTVTASPPARLAGLLECRGLGILRLRSLGAAPVVLVADLDTGEDARLPQPRKSFITVAWLPLIAGRGRANLAEELTVILRSGRDPVFLDPEDPQHVETWRG